VAVAVIPFVPSIGEYDFDVVIEGDTYLFDPVRWNEHDQAWYFDLLEADRTPILQGAKITVGSYIGRYSTHKLFQRGVIAAVDTSGDYRAPTFDDLGTRVEVRFYRIEDLVAEMYAV
jgi:hypothetical protein